MPFDTWLLYLLTCLGMAVVPGPNALLVLTHGAIYGRKETLFTISGGVLGFIAMISLCATGLAVLIKTSVTVFTALKVLGGLYLIWIGISLWRSTPLSLDSVQTAASTKWSLFRQGLLSALSNPKALLLYTAFIPPFLDAGRNLFIQTVVIALTYAVVEFLVEYIVASGAHRVRPWLAKTGRRFNQTCGGFFMIFGALLPIRS
ncbi:LysE family translocator [Metapseudomonas furukawaii]|uniref:Homoserine/homoserine lactone efflux protein n=1 Tax=Metapseudomonas furukawaii TaxID=1149133 RepID=A0AAD1BZJ1_METFU|nr:LysE family translocator [Pseudomonas furukawaii]ELS26467.1 Hypothetical protein ppKF707_1422 [Pseudomonas furukawaii]BAU74153.1 homoserine/homoserine lactone efflux protein [Pseudomonas furukawaii]